MEENILTRVINRFRARINIESNLKALFMEELENSGDKGYAIIEDKKVLTTLHPYTSDIDALLVGIDDNRIMDILNTSYKSNDLTSVLGYPERSTYITDRIEISSGIFIKIMFYLKNINQHSPWMYSKSREVVTLESPTENVGIFIVTDYDDINKEIFKDVSSAMVDSQCKEENDE